MTEVMEARRVSFTGIDPVEEYQMERDLAVRLYVADQLLEQLVASGYHPTASRWSESRPALMYGIMCTLAPLLSSDDDGIKWEADARIALMDNSQPDELPRPEVLEIAKRRAKALLIGWSDEGQDSDCWLLGWA